MTVKDKDRGYAALVKRLREASKGATVRAGIHSDDGTAKEGELTVIDIATFHEFGTSRIPARSFVGAWMDLHRQDVADLYGRQVKLWLKGAATYDQVLGRVGAYMSGGMKKRIAERIPPPLSPVTIRRKGSSVPLIDTGQLRNSLTFSFTWSGGEHKEESTAGGILAKARARAKAKAYKKEMAGYGKLGRRFKAKQDRKAARNTPEAIKARKDRAADRAYDRRIKAREDRE